MTLGAVTPAVLPMGIWLLTTRKQLLVYDGFVDHVTTNMEVQILYTANIDFSPVSRINDLTVQY